MNHLLNGKQYTFQVESVLGRGAMGVVCQAKIIDTDQNVAIKTLREDLLAGGERDNVIGRFKREVAISMNLSHPNIVKVMDSGHEGETLFLAMELINGKELKEFLDSFTPLPLPTIILLMEQLLAGLDYSASRGVIHRDIKPANIMVNDEFSIKIMDFGIARFESSEMTQAGDMLGTPAYMSPEQIRGEDVDCRSDIFSAGVVLYQLLTGKKPFTGQLAAIMHQILNEMPPPPSSLNSFIPKNLDEIVLTSLAKDPFQRYSSAAEFSKALKSAWEESKNIQSADEDATIFAGSDETVISVNTGEIKHGEGINELALKIRKLIDLGIDQEVTSKIIEELKKLFSDYKLSIDEIEKTSPNMSVIAGSNKKLFDEKTFDELKNIIIREAPVPGKEISIDDRNDWMLCIDLFSLLGKKAVEFGEEDKSMVPGQAIKSSLLSSAMMYANNINQLLFSPDHLELNLISADFMRLDILQWGLEELGGNLEVQQMHNNIKMFAGQVLQKVNASIQDFVTTREMLARFDVANLLLYIDELIVIAARIIESPSLNGQIMPSSNLMGQGIILQFIDNASKVAEIFVDELKAELKGAAELSSFESRLRLLGRLYQFSVLFDDEACRASLKRLTDVVYTGVQVLTSDIKNMLNITGQENGIISSQELQGLLTSIYEIAEELGWTKLKQSLMMDIRDHLFSKEEDATICIS